MWKKYFLILQALMLVKSAFSVCEKCSNDTDCGIFFKICNQNSGVCESESGYSNPLCPNVPNITEPTSFPSYQPSNYYPDYNYPTYYDDDESLDPITIFAVALGFICLIMLACCCCDKKNGCAPTPVGDADCGAGCVECCAGDCCGGCVF